VVAVCRPPIPQSEGEQGEHSSFVDKINPREDARNTILRDISLLVFLPV